MNMQSHPEYSVSLT